jgi:hypothetical protein
MRNKEIWDKYYEVGRVEWLLRVVWGHERLKFNLLVQIPNVSRQSLTLPRSDNWPLGSSSAPRYRFLTRACRKMMHVQAARNSNVL